MGWKLVHADVFRHPQHISTLTALVASGIQVTIGVFLIECFSHWLNQVIAAFVISLAYEMFGFLSSTHEGVFPFLLLWSFCVMSFLSAFSASRLLGLFYGNDESCLEESLGLNRFRLGPPSVFSSVALISVYPLGIFLSYVVFHILLYFKGSTEEAFPRSFLSLVSFWLQVSIPLSIFGSWIAKRSISTEVTGKSSPPRQIPSQVRAHNHFLFSLNVVTLFEAVVFSSSFRLSPWWDYSFLFRIH